MATLVTRYCRKANQLQSMQGFEMQRTHKKVFQPKKHKKLLLWQLGMKQCLGASDYSVNFGEREIHDCLQHNKYS